MRHRRRRHYFETKYPMANRWKYMGHEIGVRFCSLKDARILTGCLFSRVGCPQILNRLRSLCLLSIDSNGEELVNMPVYPNITNDVPSSISTATKKMFMTCVTNGSLSLIMKQECGMNRRVQRTRHGLSIASLGLARSMCQSQ